MRPYCTIAICPACSKIFVTTPRRLRRQPPPTCSWECAMAQRRRPIGDRLWPHVNKTDTCWLWTGYVFSATGYGGISAGSVIDRTNTMITTHKVAWELASGAPVPDGKMVLHVCDVRRCIRNDEPGTYEVAGVSYPRFGHLFLADALANVLDMYAKGRAATDPDRPRGADHGMAVLSPSQAIEIIALHNQGLTYAEIAPEFDVGEDTVGRVVRGKHWSVRDG